MALTESCYDCGREHETAEDAIAVHDGLRTLANIALTELTDKPPEHLEAESRAQMISRFREEISSQERIINWLRSHEELPPKTSTIG
jgi:hypothetical protein